MFIVHHFTKIKTNQLYSKDNGGTVLSVFIMLKNKSLRERIIKVGDVCFYN